MYISEMEVTYSTHFAVCVSLQYVYKEIDYDNFR